MAESIAEELLRRKGELIEGWHRWVHRMPASGEQCVVLDDGRIALTSAARMFLDARLPGLSGVVGFNDHHSKVEILDWLDEQIAYAKDHEL